MNTNLEDKHDLNKESVDITPELKIRKILEANTNYKFVFEKNPDEMGIDLKVFKYKIFENKKYTKEFKGYIEIEWGHNKWNNYELPYPVVSFLNRKLTRSNTDRTIYLKFNQPFTNCFAITIQYILQNGKKSERGDGSYHETFIELGISEVIWGIKRCCEFIENTFDNIDINLNKDF